MPLFSNENEKRIVTTAVAALIFAMKLAQGTYGSGAIVAQAMAPSTFDEAEAFVAEAKRRYG